MRFQAAITVQSYLLITSLSCCCWASGPDRTRKHENSWDRWAHLSGCSSPTHYFCRPHDFAQ